MLSPIQAQFLSGDAMSGTRHNVAMLKGRTPLTQTTRHLMEMTGKRLDLLASLHAMGPVEVEECLELTRGHWRLMCRGERPLSIEKAILVCDQFGVTLDWLYRGKPATALRPDVLVNVVAVRPELTERRDMAARTDTAQNLGMAFSQNP